MVICSMTLVEFNLVFKFSRKMNRYAHINLRHIHVKAYPIVKCFNAKKAVLT